MKKMTLSLMTLWTVLLCGCARDLPVESTISLEVDFPMETLKSIVFSECHMSDYTFTAACKVQEDGVYKRYSGEIIDDKIKTQLWDILCRQEKMQTYQVGRWGGGGDLVLTDKHTGETFNVGYGIWYEKPENEGGPSCFVISGSSCGTACYYSIDSENRFEELLIEGVKRDENLTHQESIETNGYTKSAIVLVSVYMNRTEEFQYNGEVIDLEGNVFTFDFSDHPDQSISWEEAGQKLYELYEECELKHIGTVNAEVIEKCWIHGTAVDSEALMKEEHSAYGMGQCTLCLFDIETGTLIPLHSTGDYHRELQDDAAMEIVKLYDKMKIE